MTEYLIIVALIAISAIAATRKTGSWMKAGFQNIAGGLEGVFLSPR
jgi:Flp pilus assembly pilin Flp